MKLRPEHVPVIIDTRENTPWDLSPMATERGTLPTGDYSIRGLEHVVVIERKSLPDLLGCIGKSRDRFEREVQRLLAYPVKALVVESTWQEIQAGNYRSDIHPNAVVGSLMGWLARGLPVLLAGDHTNAGRLAARLLFTTARRRIEENEKLLAEVSK